MAGRFHTRLCDVLGIDHPIIQAGMGGGLTPARLAAAVSTAGGLGTIGTAGTPRDFWVEQIRQARTADRPFAVNVLMQQDEVSGWQEQLVEVCLEERVPAVSFAWAGAERFFGRLQAQGIHVLH